MADAEVVEKKEEAKVEDKEKEQEKEEEKKPEIDAEREGLLEKGEVLRGEKESPEKEEEESEEKEEKEEKEEEEIEEGDLNELLTEFPQLAKLGIKSVKELAERYAGGVEQFNKDREFVAELEKRGIKNPREREELLEKLTTGKHIKITEKKEPDEPKSFSDTRKDSFSQLIPKQIQTEEIDENGNPIVRDLTEEEKKTELERFHSSAEMIYPSEHANRLNTAEKLAFQTYDDRVWEDYQLKRLLKEKFKDEIPPDDLRTKIQEFMKPYPATRDEIVRKAINEGKNYMEALHHYYLSQVKKDEIDKAKEERIRKQVEEEMESRSAGKTETKGKKGEPLGKSKSFDEMSDTEKRQDLISKGKLLRSKGLIS